MRVVSVNGTEYQIHFRYLTKSGKRPHFRKHAPFQAVTMCTVMADGGKFIAQDIAVCSEAVATHTPAMRQLLGAVREVLDAPFDQFGRLEDLAARVEAELKPDQYSRREGRLRSLEKVVSRCGRLRKIGAAFMQVYLEVDPPPPVPERREISEQRREELIAAGQEGKEERRARRKLERVRRKAAG